MKTKAKYCCIYILVFHAFILTAQESNKTIDSLLTVLKSAKEDTSKVNTLNALSRNYLNTGKNELAMQYAQQAWAQAEKLRFLKGTAGAYTNIAYIYNAQGNYKKALDNFFNTVSIRERIGDKKGVAGSFIWIGNIYLNYADYTKALNYFLKSIAIYQEIMDKQGMPYSYNGIGNVYFYQGNFPEALEYYRKAGVILAEIGDKKGIAFAANNVGICYKNMGDYRKALENHLIALTISEEAKDRKIIASSYTNIGIIYVDMKNYEKALENILKAIKINEELNDKWEIADSYLNIGSIYEYLGNYEKALDNFLLSLKISEEVGHKQGISHCYTSIGEIHEKQGDYKKALENELKATKIAEEIGDTLSIITTYSNIGNIYSKLGKLKEALHYQNLSLVLAQKNHYKVGLKDSYSYLSELFQRKGNYKQAYEYHKLYSDIKDTLLNEQSSKQITEMNVKYESEKKEKDIQLLMKDKELQQAEIGRQKLIRNGFVGGLIIVLLISFVIFNRFQVTRKQKKIIEFQNSQIVESINYSKRIQDSLLPSVESMQKALPSLFVFYEPKDVVSGDFYFFKEFQNYLLLACVDCTGHGVPGGFMSTLGSLLLDKIANDESLKPSEILSKLSDEIIRILHQQDGGEIQDGMDLSICLIDKQNRSIEFSGARNGIIIVTGNEAKRYKASPLPVGGNYMKKGIAITRNFQTQSISLNTNDWVYMYTDGFIEQVGGKEGIPMNYEQFEKQLINVSNSQTAEGKIKLLQTELNNWKGANERTDDMLIMGFQVV